MGDMTGPAMFDGSGPGRGGSRDQLVEREALQPVIHEVLPMSKVREGHRMLEARKVFGRVVLTPW